MNSKVFSLLSFVVGAAVGAGATFVYMKEQNRKQVLNEVSAMDEYYSKREQVEDTEEVVSKSAVDISGKENEYYVSNIPVKKVTNTDSIDYSKITKKPSKDVSNDDKSDDGIEFEIWKDGGDNVDPVAKELLKDEEEDVFEIIEYDDFLNKPGYEAENLIAYSDDILAVDGSNKLTDVNSTIGSRALAKLGTEEDAVIFVRNNKNKVEYEVIRSTLTYQEACEERIDY